MKRPEGPGARWKPAVVECYAGHRRDETPRAVMLNGVRSEITAVLSRERIMDNDSREVRERWRCRLDDGRIAVLERLADGTWRAKEPT